MTTGSILLVDDEAKILSALATALRDEGHEVVATGSPHEAQRLLAQRLFDQRIVALAGELDAESANRAVAELGLLDASGDEPVQLRLSGVGADLGTALTVVDALDLMGAPVHATCLGTLTGPAVALLAVADRRSAGRHTMLHLCEPRAPHVIGAREVESLAAEHARQLRRLQERLAEASGHPVEEIAADMRAGRLLTASEARDYGLIDTLPS